MTTPRKCQGFSANRRFENCTATVISEVETRYDEDGRPYTATVTRNLDGTPHSCPTILTAYAKRHPVKGGLSAR